jgi:NADPH:quinone reductase-like Zn-dependent oxidoreductase
MNSSSRRELAKRLGADLVLDLTQEDVAARIREETSGAGETSKVVFCHTSQ